MVHIINNSQITEKLNSFISHYNMPCYVAKHYIKLYWDVYQASHSMTDTFTNWNNSVKYLKLSHKQEY